MFFDPMFFPKWETASGGILFLTCQKKVCKKEAMGAK